MSSVMQMILSQPPLASKYMAMLGQTGQLGGGAPNVGPTGGSSDWEQRARRMAINRYGYTPEEFNKLDSIIERESGWDPNAVNEGSGAYGIPQILPSAHPNADLQGDPVGQLKWLFNYIQGRYGGINEALSFKDANGWY